MKNNGELVWVNFEQGRPSACYNIVTHISRQLLLKYYLSLFHLLIQGPPQWIISLHPPPSVSPTLMSASSTSMNLLLLPTSAIYFTHDPFNTALNIIKARKVVKGNMLKTGKCSVTFCLDDTGKSPVSSQLKQLHQRSKAYGATVRMLWSHCQDAVEPALALLLLQV